METFNLTKIIVVVGIVSLANLVSADTHEAEKHETGLKKTRVIHNGQGKPTTAYISKIKIGRSGNALNKSKFPVVTKELSVGRVGEEEATNARYEAAVRPLFIIGYDATSVEWLQSNAEILKEKNAVGYVANVETEEQLSHLNAILDNKVLLLAMNASDIANKLNIKHYPFYMDRNGILR